MVDPHNRTGPDVGPTDERDRGRTWCTEGVTETRETTPETTRNAADVGVEESRAAWVAAARPVLIETARSYRAVVTHKELAEAVQERSGIHTEQRVHYWIDDILGRSVATTPSGTSHCCPPSASTARAASDRRTAPWCSS